MHRTTSRGTHPFAAAVVMAALAAAGLSCGGGPSFDSFAGQYSRATCKRRFECCAPRDRQLPADTDEAACVTLVANGLHHETASTLAGGAIRYDDAAAQKCLDSLQLACAELFDAKVGPFPACRDVFPGALPLGALCFGDGTCVSGACGADRTCVARSSACDTRVALGGACDSCSRCEDGLACLGKRCATPLPDGQPCSAPTDCLNACLSVSAGAAACGAPLCQGTGA